MRQFSVLLGALRYEFRMQVRRPALWITLILIEVFVVGLFSRFPGLIGILTHLSNYALLTVVVSWTHYVMNPMHRMQGLVSSLHLVSQSFTGRHITSHRARYRAA